MRLPNKPYEFDPLLIQVAEGQWFILNWLNSHHFSKKLKLVKNIFKSVVIFLIIEGDHSWFGVIFILMKLDFLDDDELAENIIEIIVGSIDGYIFEDALVDIDWLNYFFDATSFSYKQGGATDIGNHLVMLGDFLLNFLQN